MPVQCYGPAASTACSLQSPMCCGIPVAPRTTPFAARYDIGALQRGTFKNSTLGVFINLEWRAFRNSGSGHVRNSELGTTFDGHSDLGAQLGRKNQPACLLSVSLSVTLVYCGQTVAWIKKKLGMLVGLGPSHIVLDGDSAPPPPKGIALPQFLAHVCCGQMAGWIKMSLGMEVGLGSGHIVLDEDPAHIADFEVLRDVAMATIFWLSVYGGTYWRHLVNTTEPSECCSDAALRQISLTTCFTFVTFYAVNEFYLYFDIFIVSHYLSTSSVSLTILILCQNDSTSHQAINAA